MERRLRSLAAVCFAFVSAAVSSASAQSAPEQPPEPAGAQPSGAQPPAAEATPAPANEWANVKFGATFEGYYQYNWNRPPDRTLLLRAYDTRSNTFSIQQAALVVDARRTSTPAAASALRVDLQFGQATETVQGGAANEPRPDVYRHIWQAYGTYLSGRRQRAAGRLRQVRVDPRLRNQLREGQPAVLARLSVQLPAVLSLGPPVDAAGQRQGHR